MILLCALLIVTNVFTMEITRNAEESPLLLLFVAPLTVLRLESFCLRFIQKTYFRHRISTAIIKYNRPPNLGFKT